ncbi:MAG: hypothetical protein KKA73_28270 [Chloroflexi bacterium]|nr:hypothetical protein [Chloroflexota bacterium]MBU1751590.1 hypothetical protein [Chloroflexota bacterium]
MEGKYSSGVRWLLYIASFLSLLVGVIIGIVLMTQDDEESKKVGKNCLIAVAIGLIVWVACGLLMTVLGLLMFFVTGIAAYTTSMLLLPVV